MSDKTLCVSSSTTMDKSSGFIASGMTVTGTLQFVVTKSYLAGSQLEDYIVYIVLYVCQHSAHSYYHRSVNCSDFIVTIITRA